MKALEKQKEILQNKAKKAYEKYQKTDKSTYYFAYEDYMKAASYIDYALHYYKMAENT